MIKSESMNTLRGLYEAS
jgi:hypothetical protein